MRTLKLFILCLSSFQIISCNNENSTKEKAKTDTTISNPTLKASTDTSRLDIESFLKSRNMILASYSDIPANSSMIVPGTSVYYPILNMASGSKLIIPSSFANCTIIIGKGYFDANTEIVADGDNGKNGFKPVDDWDRFGFWQAGEGRPGAKGVNGTDGTPGTNAVRDVTIQIGLMKLLTLNIHANGGNGGDGGDGGTGQIGGNKSGPFGSNGNGGPGGDGGSGKNGGDGGNVSVELWAAGGGIDLPTVMQHLSVLAKGGNGGKAGNPGNGREAGNSSGPSGGPGKIGNKGQSGRNGTTKITVIAKPPLP